MVFWLEKSGLEIGIDENMLVFGNGLKKTVPQARHFQDLEVVFEKKPPKPDTAAYFMYRDVCLQEDEKKIAGFSLRYDITVIPPAVVGDEFVKTFGHCHPKISGKNVSFPEVYEVLAGKGHFVLQAKNDFFVVEGHAGDKILIPPDMTHVTINPLDKTLVMANWVERNFESDYSGIMERHGAAFFETVHGWKKNQQYLENFSFHFLKPKNVKEFGLEKGKPIYSLVNEIERLEFLKSPQKYEAIFEKYLQKEREG